MTIEQAEHISRLLEVRADLIHRKKNLKIALVFREKLVMDTTAVHLNGLGLIERQVISFTV